MNAKSLRERQLNTSPSATRIMASDAGGATFEEIGEAIGVSRWRAQQICNRALWKLQRACRQAGLDASDIRGRVGSMLAQAEMWGSE